MNIENKCVSCNKPTFNRKYCSAKCSGKNSGNLMWQHPQEPHKCLDCDETVITNKLRCETCIKIRRAKLHKERKNYKEKGVPRTIIQTKDSIKINQLSYCNRCNQELDENNGYKRGDKYYTTCKACQQKYVSDRETGLKKCLVEYKGGRCERCGYCKNYAVLQFHHRDPTQKEFTISDYKISDFNDDIKDELDKCVLLCANCHGETHYPHRTNINISTIRSLADLIKLT